MPQASETGMLALGNEHISYVLIRSRRRKRTIAFKMQHDSSLHVLAPAKASLDAVTKILHKRATWITRELARRRENPLPCDYRNGSLFIYLGHECVLRVTQGGDAPRSCRLWPHRLHVHVPDKKLSGDDLREEVRLEIALWLRKRAKLLLKKRLDLWARRMGLSYKKLIVTDPERRWGSCGADNVIRLNWRLMHAPLPVVDYVVAHELAHIPHKNHGPRFWACVARAMPDYLARRKILRQIE